MYRLVGTDGKRFYSWLLSPGEFVVGRKEDCDFTIPHRTVSRKHARVDVSKDGSTLFLTDLGSHNGTLLNGRKVEKQEPLDKDDTVQFGQTEFRISDGDDIANMTSVPSRTTLAENEPEKSVFLSINDALKPLPVKATESGRLIPTLFEMAKLLTLPEPQEVILTRSLELVGRAVPSQRLAVLLVSDDQEEVFTAATQLAEDCDHGAFELSRTIVREIITNRNAILIGDPADDPRFAQQHSIIMSEMKSAIAVPLFDEGQVLGILYADTTDPLQRYQDEHLRVLATFGNIIAAKMQSYTLLAERQDRKVMEVELSRASNIQKRLLVSEFPQVTSWEIQAHQEQSRSVGGDLYDVKLLENGRLLILVADVSGKGLGAALLMSNILASFRTLYEGREFDIGDAVRRVSRQVLNFSDAGDFATLFIAEMDESGNLKYINAGHNPPLLVRADGTLEHLKPSGIMIGAFDFSDWEEHHLTFKTDDVLFIFSDGVTEAERDGVQYGDELTEEKVVLWHDLSPRDLLDNMMEDINTFMGDAPRSDDITMLAVKRTKT